jgi:predicted nucleic acid-binding protein
MKAEVCLDASVPVKLVLRGESLRAQARQLVADCIRTESRFVAPPFYKCEVDSIIRHRVFAGRITLEEGVEAFRGLDAVEVSIFDPPEMRLRAREIAKHFNQARVYDATYAALAELRGCEFWTADHAFYTAVRNELPFVRFLADYPLP